MPSYILRDLDPQLWAAFKKRAEADGRGQKWLILRLVELYTKAGLERLEKAAK